jgi:hypothetical protein
MPKARTTVSLDEDVFRAVKIKAARTGKRDSQVIEESLRRDLGIDDLAEIVSGDRHLLELAEKIPVFSPAEFLAD